MRSGGLLGNVPLGAGAGPFILPLQALPDGAFDSALVTFTFAGCISTAGAFAAARTGIATGASKDDASLLLLDAVTDMSWYVDRASYFFAKLAPDKIRSILMYLNGSQDFSGTFMGASINAIGGATKSLTIVMQVPFALTKFMVDGKIGVQGSLRLQRGGQFIVNVAKQGNAALVLAAGTLNYASFTCTVQMIPAQGDKTQVGPSWQADNVSGYPNNVLLQNEVMLLILQDAVLNGNAIAAQGITIHGQEDKLLVDPPTLAAGYLSDHPIVGGGFDPTQNMVPFVWIPSTAQFLALPDPTGTTIIVPGAASLNLCTVKLKGKPADILGDVASTVNGGGAIDEAHPAIHSMAAGTGIPANKVSMAPSSFHLPGQAPGGGVRHASSVSVQAIGAVRQIQHHSPGASAVRSMAGGGGARSGSRKRGLFGR